MYIHQVKAELLWIIISILNIILSSHHYQSLSMSIKCSDNWKGKGVVGGEGGEGKGGEEAE